VELTLWPISKLRDKSRLPAVPPGLRLYAIGDIHGRADLLRQVFTKIDADLMNRPATKAVEVFLGDYIDRGPQSRQVIDSLIDRKQRRRVICLKGNHEDYIRGFLRDPWVFDDWRQYGALETLMSYGLAPKLFADLRTDREKAELANVLLQSLPPAHRRFFASLPVTFSCGDFLFVHAGVKPGVPLDNQKEDDLLWIRDDFLLCEDDFGKVIVHGHTPVREPDFRSNRINIDTGAYATGRLTCAAFEHDQVLIL
jgi:serine/threonine protein phosphatase 1